MDGNEPGQASSRSPEDLARDARIRTIIADLPCHLRERRARCQAQSGIYSDAVFLAHVHKDIRKLRIIAAWMVSWHDRRIYLVEQAIAKRVKIYDRLKNTLLDVDEDDNVIEAERVRIHIT